MSSYVALIRGINVGGKNPLPMKDLKQLLEQIGCGEVRTYIQSGNVVFRSDSTAPRLRKEIADNIEADRGFEPHVMVLKRSEFKRAKKTPDWTAGCIAVKNDEIEEIYAMVNKGTVITLRP